jgi:hypothetical protein
MGYGPVKNGKHRPITPYEGSWAWQQKQKKQPLNAPTRRYANQ